MEPNKNRQPDGVTELRDAVLVRWTATMLPPDSPEALARANRPLSERGPNLALYHALANGTDTELSQPEAQPATSDNAPNPGRKRSPYTENSATRVEFTATPAPLDGPQERIGRPERSPSLPPLDEPKPAEQPPAQ